VHKSKEEVAKHLWLNKYFDIPVRKNSPLVLADMFYPELEKQRSARGNASNIYWQ